MKRDASPHIECALNVRARKLKILVYEQYNINVIIYWLGMSPAHNPQLPITGFEFMGSSHAPRRFSNNSSAKRLGVSVFDTRFAGPVVV